MRELWPAAQWAVLAMTVVALAIAALQVWRPQPSVGGIYESSRTTGLGHVVMLSAMLAMFVAAHESVSTVMWSLLFGAVAVGFASLIAVRLWKRASYGNAQHLNVAAPAYHVFAALVMIYAVQPVEGNTHHVHSHSGVAALPFLTTITIAIFVADAIITAAIIATLRAPGIAPGRLPTSIRLTQLPHIAMDITMAVMLGLRN